MINVGIIGCGFVGGVHAKRLINRFDVETIYLLLESQWWNIEEMELKENSSQIRTLRISNLQLTYKKLNRGWLIRGFIFVSNLDFNWSGERRVA